MQPEQLGPFRIGRVLGRGGMGAVYEGVHIETEEAAAVKVLLSTLQDDNELRLRFEAEIDTLKRLHHPNIVRLFGFGEEQGMLYYVMELVDGPSLQQEMKRQRLFQWYEVAKIGLEMCLAFKHAHDRGITHRDIKPANILLERQGSIKLSDFGIAHFFGGHRFTEANSIVGTLEYMSPEQALANPVSSRSDLYSLGAVLYSLLVGRPPFIARSLPEILRKHQNGVFDSIRATRLDVPDELEIIIADLLKMRPEDRPHNDYLVVKRFQSLLQALVGPPEQILVKPMEADAPTTPPLGPVHIPYKRDSEPNEKILRSRGIVANTGIIDLGGIVDSGQENEFDSYSNGDGKNVTDETLYVSTDGLQKQEIHDCETLIASDIKSRESENSRSESDLTKDIAEKKTEEISPKPYENKNEPIRVTDIKNEISPTETLASELKSFSPQQSSKTFDALTGTYGIQDEPKMAAPFNASPFRSEIRYGEIVMEDLPEMRRTKDEPLPDINIFDAFPRKKTEEMEEENSEEKEQQTAEINLETQNTEKEEPFVPKVSTNGLGTNRPPEFASPPIRLDSSKSVKKNILEPPKSLDSYELQKPIAANPTGNRERDTAITDRPTSSSHFTAVKVEDLDDFVRANKKYRPLVSLQTVLASLCLILIGFFAYYLLQPVSPSVLYERIKLTINENNNGDGISPSTLRMAEDDINHFLLEYAQHPMADQVRYYKTELELVQKELELKRRQRLNHSELPTPVEQAYMEAIALMKTEPEKAMTKLKAIIDVFRSDQQSDQQADVTNEIKKTKTIRRQQLSPEEICVELAFRRLEELEKNIETIKSVQLQKIQKRLEKADEIEATQPERAESIRRGLLELYRNQLWAKEVIKESQRKLEETNLPKNAAK
jgi:serine/threonine protein kinase